MHVRQKKSTLETLTRYSNGETISHEVMRVVASDILEMHNTISEELAELEKEYDVLFHDKQGDGNGNTELQPDQEDFSIDNLLVYFPPDGKDSLELSFFLEHEGKRFFQYYQDLYERHTEKLPFCETYEQYLSQFLEPAMRKYTTIRLGVDPFDRKTTWMGLKDKDQFTLNFLPQVNYDFFHGSAQYRSKYLKSLI